MSEERDLDEKAERTKKREDVREKRRGRRRTKGEWECVRGEAR